MKKTLLFVFLACAPLFMKAQCFVQVQVINATCNGVCDGSASAFPVGTGPFTYNWMPGGQTTQTINGLCAGSYTVIVIDGTACTSTASFTVTEPQQLMVATSPQPASCQTCCDGFIISTVFGGTAPYTYMWSTSPTQSTSTAQAVCPGTYTLCVTDANGCVSCTTSTVSFMTGISDQSATGNLSVYPSPASQSVTLDETFEKASNVEISVSNLLGQVVYVNNLGSMVKIHHSIDISNLPEGIYLIMVKTNTGSSVRKIIKE